MYIISVKLVGQNLRHSDRQIIIYLVGSTCVSTSECSTLVFTNHSQEQSLSVSQRFRTFYNNKSSDWLNYMFPNASKYGTRLGTLFYE